MKQVYEETSAWYTGTLKDQDGTVVPRASVATMLLTLYEKTGESIINSRDQVDVYNGGAWDQGVTLHETSGLLTVLLTADDNAIVNSSNDGTPEVHVLVIEGTLTGSSSPAYAWTFEFQIKNRVKTT